MDFADGVAGLCVGSGSNGAGIQHNEFGRRAIGRGGTALFTQLVLDGGSVGLRGAAAKLFDVKVVMWCGRKGYLTTERWEFSERVLWIRQTAGWWKSGGGEMVVCGPPQKSDPAD